MGYLIKTIFFVFITNVVCSQISFFHYYSDNGVDKGEGIVQLEDSSYVITGSSSSFVEGQSQAFLMKIDSLGNRQWSNHYGGSGSESGRRVLYKKDFGFYICGFTNSIGNGGFDNYLAKIDEDGNLEWEKAIGGSGWEKVHDAALTRDTGVIMIGESSSNLTNNKDIYIARTDINGDTLWTRTIGDGGDDFASDVLAIDDSTFIVVGRYFVEDSLLTKCWASKIGDDGTVYWGKTFGVIQNSWANGVELRGNELRIVGGSSGTTCNGIDVYDNIFTKEGGFWGEFVQHVDGDEELISIVTFGTGQDSYLSRSHENNWTFVDGRDLAINRYSNSPFSWIDDFKIGRVGDDVSGQIIKTSDGSAITVGYSTNAVSGGNDIYVCKIGAGSVYPNTETGVNNNLVTIIEGTDNKGFKVYPNPSNGHLTISFEDGVIDELKVLSMTGELLYRSSSESLLDLSALISGCYIMKITSGSTVVTRRVVIQH